MNNAAIATILKPRPGEFSALAALTGMEQLLEAQRQQFQVVYRTYFSRINIRGFVTNPLTGLVENLNATFFTTAPGNRGSGFDRPLTEADVSITSPGLLAANKVFVADYCGIRVDTSMPEPTQRTILNRGLIKNVRGNLGMTLGRGVDWPCPLGISTLAAATTNAQTTIAPFGNGVNLPMQSLPLDGMVFFPAKQEIQWTYGVQGAAFYATTNGLILANDGSNALIPNQGEQGEEAGYLELLFRGYEITQPG
jgi:hypothetical protein